MSPDLSIIIVNWKSRDYVRACLKSLVSSHASLHLEIIVVDNASFDGVEVMLASEFPEVLFLQCERNLGFSGANNLALSHSSASTILFLNPDTEVQGEALSQLLQALHFHPDAGMVGCRILNADYTLQTTCITAIPSLANQLLDCDLLKRRFPAWPMWGKQALWAATQTPKRVEAISGACMMARKDVLDQIGAFNTAYFMYAEDMDLCLKTVRAGWSIYYVPEAIILHHGGGSSARRESHFSNIALRTSVEQFFRMYRGSWYAACYRVGMLATALFRMLALSMLLPFLLWTERSADTLQSLGKWWHIFVWSAGLSRLQSGVRASSSSTRSKPLQPA